MESMPRDDQELICPSCYGEVETVYPYYTASEHLLFTSLKNHYTWWIVIGIVTLGFWPLGLVGLVVLLIYEVKEAKNRKLYKCEKCNIQFSYEDASNAARNAT